MNEYTRDLWHNKRNCRSNVRAFCGVAITLKIKEGYYMSNLTQSNLVFQPKPVDPRFQDLTGRKFGRLTVLGFAGMTLHRDKLWHCQCECGNIKENVRAGHLADRNVTSCGCFSIAKKTRHGQARRAMKTPEYSTWIRMHERCSNSKNPFFKHYGGRGIRVCDEWTGNGGFERFRLHVGERPSKDYSIDRINNDGNYEPGNVRWATSSTQARNKQHSRIVEFEGESKHLMQWAEQTGIGYGSLANRIYTYKWTIKDALTIPVWGRRNVSQ